MKTHAGKVEKLHVYKRKAQPIPSIPRNEMLITFEQAFAQSFLEDNAKREA